MKRIKSNTWLRAGIVLGMLSVVALAMLSGVGLAQGQVVPTNSTEPRISGKAVTGSVLTTTKGSWTGSPTSYDIQWTRCPASGGASDASNCAAIGGATTEKYIPGADDAGNRLRVRVSASNADGTKTAASNASSIVKVGDVIPTPAPTGCPKKGASGAAVPVAGVSLPARLTIDQTQVSPSTITYGTRSITARFHVSACDGPVEGALVYVTAVPYGQFAIPNEQATGSDGWATLEFSAVAGYPVGNKQQLLVMFARARKAGDSLLGGISTRRLVSFRVTQG